MTEPRLTAKEIYTKDRFYREEDGDTWDFQFQEPGPVAKLIYTIRPDEFGIIRKTSYASGSNDSSVNGFVHLPVTRIPNPTAYVLSNAQNQVIFRKFGGPVFVEGSEDHSATPIYLRQGEEFYIYLFSNFPAPAKVYGNLVMNVLPTYR